MNFSVWKSTCMLNPCKIFKSCRVKLNLKIFKIVSFHINAAMSRLQCWLQVFKTLQSQVNRRYLAKTNLTTLKSFSYIKKRSNTERFNKSPLFTLSVKGTLFLFWQKFLLPTVGISKWLPHTPAKDSLLFGRYLVCQCFNLHFKSIHGISTWTIHLFWNE